MIQIINSDCLDQMHSIEREKEYVEIAQARIDNYKVNEEQLEMFA